MSIGMGIDNQQVTLRAGRPDDAAQLHTMIEAHLEEGRLLPRTAADLTVHASRFVVAAQGQTVVGCAELAPLSSQMAEVRSLVVDRPARGRGLALRMVDALARRARREGFARLSAFAHDAALFVGLGFSIVPHTWVPEKIAHDCAACPLFRGCGQHALILALDEGMGRQTAVARASGAQVLTHAH